MPILKSVKYYLLSFSLIPFMVFSQIGGSNVYEFIDLSTSAHTSALGGHNISLKGNELGFAFKTPSLLDSTCNNMLEASRSSHFESYTGIFHGNFMYANQYKNYYFLVGFQYVNYGEFNGYDEQGNYTNTFTASDYMPVISAARQISNRITVGASVKPIISQIETYKSYGISTDYSATYNDTAHLFTASLLVRNLGLQIKPYINDQYENLPFGIDIGITKKLKHAPLRLSLTYHDIQSFDSKYSKESYSTSLLNKESDEPSAFEEFSDDLLSHINIGAEILLFKNMFLAGGFNMKRRQELQMPESAGTVGFSFGFGLKIYKFHISYAHENYHVAGGTNVFTLRTDIKDFIPKRYLNK